MSLFEGEALLRELGPPQPGNDLQQWLTVGAPALAKSSGKWYHEVQIGMGVTAPRVGWVTDRFEESGHMGKPIGNDEHGWAADGMMHRFWHVEEFHMRWPEGWRNGDVIGCAIDIDAGEMRFSNNGRWVALTLKFVPIKGAAYFPAITAKGHFSFLFAMKDLQHLPFDKTFEPYFHTDGRAPGVGHTRQAAKPNEPHVGSPKKPVRKVYHGCPTQQSVVDTVVFGRDMDFSGEDQFAEAKGFMTMYSGAHGASTRTIRDRPKGIRTYPNTPLMQSVVDQVVYGRDMDFSGDTQFDDEFMEMFKGSHGKPSVDLKSQQAILAEQPERNAGKRVFHDCPTNQSTVDTLVFGHDIDNSGEQLFKEDFMQMYKGAHGRSSTSEEKPMGIRTYKNNMSMETNHGGMGYKSEGSRSAGRPMASNAPEWRRRPHP